MKILESKDPVITTGFHSDLFKDVIKPESFVVKRDAKRVRRAMKVIEEFRQSMTDGGILDELWSE